MKLYFFDSSAIVKRYVHEVGSPRIHTITDPKAGNILFVSRITRVEVLSALARIQREGRVDPTNIAVTLKLFEYDWMNHYQIIELDHEITERAGQLVQQYPLRAYDSVQLASALSLQSFFARIDPQLYTFICADDRLLSVAQSEEMFTDNPNTYT